MKKIALVGCGRISKRHIDAINDTEGVQIAYVCDKQADRAIAVSEQLGCQYLSDYHELDGKSIDVVSVLTPSGLHPRHVCALAELTDIPYIICEKPVASSGMISCKICSTSLAAAMSFSGVSLISFIMFDVRRRASKLCANRR